MVETSFKTQRLAGRTAGITLLLLIAFGLAGIALQQGIVTGGPQAATSILANETRFRAATLCNIFMFNCDIVLALTFYALLRPISPVLALLGAFWRVANAIVIGTGAAATLYSLSLLHGAPSTLTTQISEALRGYEGSASTIGLLFFCLGAAIHSFLLYRSKYIPQLLSGLYLAVSLQLLLGCCVVILHPGWTWALGMAAFMPDLIVELSVALWLAIKGAKISQAG